MNFQFTLEKAAAEYAPTMNDFSCRCWLACLGPLSNSVFPSTSPAILPAEKLQNQVILVHGIHDSAASMRMVAARLAHDGRAALCISLVPSDGSVSLEESAEQLRRFIDTNLAHAKRFDLVGFSMGGLVCRYYAQRLGGALRIDHLVTISAPNHGTWWAWCSNLPACRQMRPGSDFLRDLNSDCSALSRSQFVSLWTPLDLVVVPAASSRMPMGVNQTTLAIAHPLMVLSRRSLEKIVGALSDPKPRGKSEVRFLARSALPSS